MVDLIAQVSFWFAALSFLFLAVVLLLAPFLITLAAPLGMLCGVVAGLARLIWSGFALLGAKDRAAAKAKLQADAAALERYRERVRGCFPPHH